MNNSNTFANWLEGFLDACKNKPSSSQIREIRKKLSSYKSNSPKFTMLTDSPTFRNDVPPNNETLNEEHQALVDKNRSATTMEELERV